MKKILFIIVFIFSINVQSQTYIKFNTVSALALVPNIGVETSIGEKTTFSFDIMASFWESFDGKKPMKFITYTPEIRYNFKEKYKGFYTGGHIGFDTYELQKWNYWDELPTWYEKGMGYRIGATIKNSVINFYWIFLLEEAGIRGFIKGIIMTVHPEATKM